MRRRVPGRLKWFLVSGWNAAHRFGWLAYDMLNAIGHGRFERCTVCGRFRPMLYRRRIIPRRLEERWGISPRQAQAFARKESCHCTHCGANLRCRRIAQVVLNLYPVGTPPAPAPSIVDWVECAEIRRLRIAEINRIEGLHDPLAHLPGFVGSDYQPDLAPGVVEGTRSEDLTKLTYPGASFDLVLTSETLEHVPDLEAALSEIRRVLAPGGRHIFTVPLLPQDILDVSPGSAPARRNGRGSRPADRPSLAATGATPSSPSSAPIFQTCYGKRDFEVDSFFGPTHDDDMAQVYVCRLAE